MARSVLPQRRTVRRESRFFPLRSWWRKSANPDIGFPTASGTHGSAARGLVAEKFLAFLAQETAHDRDVVIAFTEYKPAGNEAGSPLVIFGAALASVRGDVFLRNAVDHRANPGPNARTGAHRTRFVRGVEDEVWQITSVAAAHVFQRFQLDVFNARARSLHAVAGATDDHFAFAHQTG